MEQAAGKRRNRQRVRGGFLLRAGGFLLLGFLSAGFAPAGALPLTLSLLASFTPLDGACSFAGFLLAAFLGAFPLTFFTLLVPALFLTVRWVFDPLRSLWDKPLLPTLTAFLLSLATGFLFWPPTAAQMAAGLLRAVLSGGFVLLSWALMHRKAHRKPLFLLFFFFFLVAAQSWSLWSFRPGHLFCFLLLLLAAKDRRTSQVFACLCGFSLLWQGGADLPLCLSFLVSGLLLPFAARKGTAALLFAQLLCLLFALGPFSEPLTLLLDGGAWALSALIYLLLPKEEAGALLASLLPGSKAAEPLHPPLDPLERLMARSETVCRRCARRDVCWGSEYADTMDGFVKLARGDCPDWFSARCTHLSDLTAGETPGALWTVYHDQRPKEGERFCGDVLLHVPLGRDQAVILADGMGSGEQAEADAKLAATLLRGSLEAGRTPFSALEETGRILAEQTRQERPVALDLAILKADGSVRLFKAGGAPSHLLGAKRRTLPATCPPLGAEDALPTHFRLSMKAGDALLLCSDGLTPDLSALPAEYAAVCTALLDASDPKADDRTAILCIRG